MATARRPAGQSPIDEDQAAASLSWWITLYHWTVVCSLYLTLSVVAAAGFVVVAPFFLSLSFLNLCHQPRCCLPDQCPIGHLWTALSTVPLHAKTGKVSANNKESTLYCTRTRVVPSRGTKIWKVSPTGILPGTIRKQAFSLVHTIHRPGGTKKNMESTLPDRS